MKRYPRFLEPVKEFGGLGDTQACPAVVFCFKSQSHSVYLLLFGLLCYRRLIDLKGR